MGKRPGKQNGEIEMKQKKRTYAPVPKEIDIDDFLKLTSIRFELCGNENLYFFLPDGTACYCKLFG